MIRANTELCNMKNINFPPNSFLHPQTFDIICKKILKFFLTVIWVLQTEPKQKAK